MSAFIPLSNAQESKSNDKELTKEEEAVEKLLTLPSITAPSAPRTNESNIAVQAQTILGIDPASATALGSAGISALTSQLSGDASTRATQLKTLVNLVEVFSNAADARTVGRRAVNSAADLTKVISSIATTITTDHLSTLGKLDTTHMSTFATDGLSNIDNFAARVDVTSAMLGSNLDSIDATNLTAVVENLHASLDGDSLTALKSLEKTHMSTLSSGIDLTTSFDASVLKKSVKKFATKAEVTVEFAKVAAGGTDLSGVDLAAVATNIHSNLDDDHLTALQQLNPTHLATMATGTDLTASGVDVAGKLKHFATKAEVVVEFAKVSVGSVVADASGSLDFSAINIDTFVTNIHSSLDEDHTAALANLDPTHMATMAAGTDLTASGIDVSKKLTHFATTAEVVVEFAKVSAGGTDLSSISIDTFVTNIHNTLDEDHTAALAKLDPTHMATMAAGTDLTASGVDVSTQLTHFATKGELASAYIDAGGASVDVAAIVTNVQTSITVEHTTSLKEFDPSHMATMITGVDIASVVNIGHKAKVAHSYKKKGDDIASILTNVANIAVADLATMGGQSLADIDKIAAGTDLTKIHEDGVHAAKLAATGVDLDEALALDPEKRKSLAEDPTFTYDPNSGTSLEDHANSAHGSAEVQDAATALKGSMPQNAYTSSPGFQAALESAITVASVLLTDRVISSDSDMDNIPEIKLSSLASNGYNTELIRLLAQYGALGSKGSALADAVLGNSYSAFNASLSLDTLDQPNVSYYQQFLSDLGARALGKEVTGSHVTSIPTSNIVMTTGANITFNAAATIDASDVLPDGKDRKIAIIGSAKDMLIKGDLTVTNSNKTENGVVVLGSADDIHIRSEYSNSSTTQADYTGNPDVVNITYTGSNAAIGSEDTMRLVNVSMSTGGNLAIGTLNELHIGTDVAQSNSISVGTGGENSDPDNVYMYANSLIQINGLNINGRVDDVYMEAITLNLRNVNFPTTSEVVLRSQMGTLHFGTFDSPEIGGVNLTNVKHGTDTLSKSSFSGKDGNWATTSTHPNGTPKVKVINF